MAKNNNARKGKNHRPVVRTHVTPGHLARIKALEAEHTQLLLANRIEYPHPDEFHTLDLSEVQARGFFGKVDLDLDSLGTLAMLARGKRKGKGKAQQGRGKTGLPNPQTVLAEVKKSITGMKPVDNTGNIVEGEWNMEFLDATKARYFLDTYKEIVPLQHILHCVEVGKAGLDVIAQATGYKAYCSADNERGNQAVGFLVHPRIKVTKVTSYNEVANVQGIGNLRPAYRIDWEDTATGETDSSVVVHMKSMRGGPKVTDPVRYQQSQKLAAALGANFKGKVGGDWNTFLNNTTCLDPLKAIGFKLLNAKDTTATHAMGSRLDGFLYLNITGLGRLKVRNFWKNTQITRQLSDHGWLNMHRRVCNTGVGTDSTCGTVDSTGTGPFGDNSSDPVEIDTTK